MTSKVFDFIWSAQYQQAQNLPLGQQLLFWKKELRNSHPDYCDDFDVDHFMSVQQEIKEVKARIAERYRDWEKEADFLPFFTGCQTFEDYLNFGIQPFRQM